MSDGHPDREGATPACRRRRRLLLLLVGAALLVISWLIARHPPIPKASSLEEVTPTYNLMAGGALPWFFQWAGVACALFGCCGSRNARCAASFAILGPFVLAAIWWTGLALKFRGMDLLDVAVEAGKTDIQLHFGSSTVSDWFLFDFIGPMLGPLQLRGPTDLLGWNFLLVMLSTTLLAGYLLMAGRLCRIGSPSNSVRDCLKCSAAMLPCFLPPLIRLGIRFASSV